MAGKTGLDSLLETGTWSTSHARSRSKSPRPPEPSPAPPPVRANQSSKIDRQVPRSFDLIPRYPPPPSVEDEAEALAKEHGSSVVSMSSAPEEEPQHRGEVEQHPILLPVHEYNPERRFVYVRPKSPGSDDTDGKYEANTCRKFTLPLRPVDKPGDEPDDARLGVRKERTRRRSELPRIETGLASGVNSRNPSRDPSRDPSRNSSPTMQRTRSATYLEQPRDYFGQHDSQAPPASAGYLSPTGPAIIKHATNGRERAYVNINGSNAGNSDGRSRSTIVHNSQAGADERGARRSGIGYDRIPHLSEQPQRHRSSSTVDPDSPTSRRPGEHRERREKYYHDGYRKDAPDPRSSNSRRDSSPSRSERRHASPSRSSRRGASPPSRSYSQRDKLSRRSSTCKNHRDSPPKDYDGSSGDEHAKSRRSRRKSFIVQEDPSSLLSPDVGHPPRPKSRQGTPLPSPRTSQNGFDLPPSSPRPSSTFPIARESREPREREHDRDRGRDREREHERRTSERSISPFSPGPSSSPPRSRPTTLAPSDQRRPGHARHPSLNTSMSSPAAIAAAMGAGAVTAAAFMGAPHIVNLQDNPIDRRRSPMPQPTASDAGTSGQPYWQPPRFAPPQQNGYLDQPVVSYRRYSEDVSSGKVPDLPICPRQVPRAGFSDWLTFPLCNNFNICPDCYTGVFAHTRFSHAFVPVPFRSLDAPIACDFGSSPWYRIAWLMTRKAQLPDLQLLQKMAAVDAQNSPCAGDQRMTRVWQTVRNPHDNRPVENFNVCSYCANSVQSLFPNLTGTFQTVGVKAEPTKGVCSLHFAPDRKRFLEYFDVLEETSDVALSRNSSPDVGQLYEHLRRISLGSCTRDQDVRGRKWFFMHGLDAFTVCKECFETAVEPQVRAKNPLACNFYMEAQRIKGPTSCQLYSPRMRRVFYEACRRNDPGWLAQSVHERLHHEQDIKDRIERCQAHNQNGDYNEKIISLEREWQNHYE